jgi:rhodanese-related sulfurtransferase
MTLSAARTTCFVALLLAVPVKADHALCRKVIDVRSLSEFDSGHISCATRIPLASQTSKIDELVSLCRANLNQPIVFYGSGGTGPGPAQARSYAISTGFTDVQDGGSYNDANDRAALEALCGCKPEDHSHKSPNLLSVMIIVTFALAVVAILVCYARKYNRRQGRSKSTPRAAGREGSPGVDDAFDDFDDPMDMDRAKDELEVTAEPVTV